MVKQTNQLKAGAIISYLQMALSVIIGLLYTPFMIHYLGKSEYGLYNTVASVISMLSILSLGFNAGYIRYYAKYKKEENNDKIYKLNGLFLIIFTIIGVIALICGLVISFNLNIVFDKGLTGEEYEIARVLMLILTANLAISFPMSVFQSIISAHEKYIFLKLLAIFKTVGGPFVTLPLLLMGFRSIAMVSVTVGVSLVIDVCYFIFVIFRLKQKFIFYDFEKGLFKDLFVFTLFIAISTIVDQINLNVDKFLLGRFKGTSSVAIYAVGYSLYNLYSLFSSSISGVFAPRIHKIVNTTEERNLKNELSPLFIKVGRIQFAILALVASGIVFFGKPFIHFWAGEGYEDAYYVALLLVLPSTIALMQKVGIDIQRALNRHKFRSIAYLIMAIGNLVMSIFLCQKYGAVGSAIGTAISLLLAQGLTMNIYYHKKCYINILSFWKNILRMSLGLIIPIICGVLINLFVDTYNIWFMLLSIAGYTFVYCLSMWFLGLNKYERGLVLKPIKKVFKLIKRAIKFLFLVVKLPFLKHEKSLRKYRNIHKGERCFIVATGPSLTIDDLNMLKGEMTFSMNSIIKSFEKTDWRPTYYVVTDPRVYETCKPFMDKNDFKQMFFRKGLNDINEDACRFSMNYISFRFSMYFEKLKIKVKPSKNISRYFNDGPSVVFSIIQLAIYMGFSEIYLLGQDCNYEEKTHSELASVEYKIKPTNKNAHRMIDVFESYSTVLDKYSVKIFNATRGGKLEVFPRVKLEDVLKEKKK